MFAAAEEDEEEAFEAASAFRAACEIVVLLALTADCGEDMATLVC